MNRDKTMFFILNTESLWQETEKVENIQVSNRGISLCKSGFYSYKDTFVPGSIEPKSLDRDACGVLYILDEKEKRILVFDIMNRRSSWIRCPAFKEPVSIAVSDIDIFVIDRDMDIQTLYCLAAVNAQIRWEIEISEKAVIAVDPLGKESLYVLDTDTENKKVFKAGREWKLSGQEIILTDEGGDDYMPDNPTDIASDREGNFYLLEAEKRKVLKFSPVGRLMEVIDIPYKEESQFLTLAVESSDNILLGFKEIGALAAGGIETFGIVQLSRLTKYEISGTYFTKIFDGTIPDCRWHRVVLDAEIPANTRVMLSYLASNQEEFLKSDEHLQSMPGHLANPRDVLLTGANGRYIRFKIELISDEAGINTPLISSLKVYFPRDSYLRYLPETFRENEASREFLERFLSLFETFMSCSEEQVYDFTQYLDPQAVPGGFIPWLSSWLAIAYDENWPPDKKRLLIQKAPGLYRKRGTRRVLSEIIELFSGRTPIIIEPFQFRCIKSPEMREVVEKLYGSSPYRFTVLVEPAWEDPDSPVKKAKKVTTAERSTMKRIIDIEKPAHTQGCLQVLEPWFYLDMHTYLGMNTVLTEPQFVLEESSVLGRDTVIQDREKAGQAGRKSRIDIDLGLT
jgi:phage tail-like protein